MLGPAPSSVADTYHGDSEAEALSCVDTQQAAIANAESSRSAYGDETEEEEEEDDDDDE